MNRRTFLFGVLSTATALLLPDKAAKKIFTMPPLVVPEKNYMTITVARPQGGSPYALQPGDELTWFFGFNEDGMPLDPEIIRVVRHAGGRDIVVERGVHPIEVRQYTPIDEG